MEYNFRIYYDRELSLSCVECFSEYSSIILKSDVLECNVATFGLNDQKYPIWSLAGNAKKIEQVNNKITIG